MGKVSPQSIKYIVHAEFSTEGTVEKPDVIGAIFGQTEGLLGEELELRELQKMGKIGRITVDLESADSKTTGKIEIPTSIDKAETAIIGAAIETIDRIGPCDASFKIKSIEDVRSNKREYVMDRAKKLLAELNVSTPKLREMEQDVSDHVKTARVVDYGRELLSAGPDIDKSSEIIVVEGRADVLALLKSGIRNSIAMNGAVIPETIKDLSRSKEITLFIDGDRGGVLNAMDAIKNANIKYVARAPDGKEVEELMDKEIHIALRNRMSVDDFTKTYIRKVKKKPVKEDYEVDESAEDKEPENIQETLEDEMNKLERGQCVILTGSASSFKRNFFSEDELSRALYDAKRRRMKVFAAVTNGIVTQGTIRAAEFAGCKYIVAKNFSATSDRIKLLSF